MASSDWKTFQRVNRTASTCGAISVGKAAAAMISLALAGVMPAFASTGILASFSGAV
ncbi:unannotated protein [freshwater metagenome]|uniref:Unannotated protein n=1 Tax=freshwater metagenome TaxID=449393 RepID=A0A6J6AIT2_9ZZZZ